MSHKLKSSCRNTSTIRLIICSLFLGTAFASANAVGQYISSGTGGFSSILISFFPAFLLTFCVSVILLYGYDPLLTALQNCKLSNKIKIIFQKKWFFPLTWLFLFLMWLPGLLASYPGVYVIDNVFQIQWFMQGTISAHHPIIHTYLLGGLVTLGKTLFGSYEAGMCMYCVLQMIILSGIFAYTINSLKERIPSLILALCLLLYAFLPCHTISSFTATKDIIYSGLFLLIVLKTWDMVMDQEAFFRSWKKPAEYVILVFLSCCFRNTGIYIFICSIPILWIVCRKWWKRVLAIFLSCLLLWGIFTGPVYNILGAAKGSSAEMLSVPMQQMALALLVSEERDSQSSLSSSDAKMIKDYIPDYQKYEARVADPVKDTFNTELFSQNPSSFIKLWLKTGLAFPLEYIGAFFYLNMGFWYVSMKLPDPGTYLAYIPYRNADSGQVGVIPGKTVYLERTSLLPGLTTFYEKYVEDGGFQNIPVLSLFYSSAFYFWLICFGIILCIYKKRYRMAAPFALLAILWLTLMVSPVVVFRYAYPLAVCFPVILGMMAEPVAFSPTSAKIKTMNRSTDSRM